MTVLARWIVCGFFVVAAMRWFRRGSSPKELAEPGDGSVAPVVEDDQDRFRFEAIHRQIIGRERAFNAIEAKLGLTALAALILVEVYFPTDLTLLDKVLAELLFVSAMVALFGFRFFAGYEAFDVTDFADGARTKADVLSYTERMVHVSARNERMIAVKQRLMLWALLPIVIVSGCVPFTRHAAPAVAESAPIDAPSATHGSTATFPPSWYSGASQSPNSPPSVGW